MGWTCFYNTHQTAAEIIRNEYTQGPTFENPHGYGFEYLTTRGNTVYAVLWHDAPGFDRKYFGAVFLTSRRKGEFCYKDMTEDMGPYQSNAPKKMLDILDRLAPNPTGYAAEWRLRCRENLARKAGKLAPEAGQVRKLGTWTYTLVNPAGPRRGWMVQRSDGTTWRMNAQQVSRASVV